MARQKAQPRCEGRGRPARRTPGYLAAALLVALIAPPSGAIVTAGESAAPPSDFPYWEHVGNRGGLSAVYWRDRWVLTARHVGAGAVRFGEREYQALPGSARKFFTDRKPADLLAFRLREDPGLAPLPIAAQTLATQTPVVMVGFGAARGDAWSNGRGSGFRWATGERRRRWGTNRIEGRLLARSGASLTQVFFTEFDSPDDGTQREGQAAAGDSGGAVFARDGTGAWELAGILVMISRPPGEPTTVALYGDRTFAADLSFYREQLDALLRERSE